ncbi:deoxyribodipyrimidine photo-lyase [candidate division KSB1 bacterium]|nr:deoxyribodipyrimidine photo-lyase [candidate division KSB1 bacterium]
MSNAVFFWFRRDLRLYDNAGLYYALKSGFKVIPVFIFDSNILDKPGNKKDKRVEFIFSALQDIHNRLRAAKSGLFVRYGNPVEVWKNLIFEFNGKAVYTNNDYEPYAITRDRQVKDLFESRELGFYSYKDQVIFEKDQVLKPDGTPYTVFTAFKNKWLKLYTPGQSDTYPTENMFSNFYSCQAEKLPEPADFGFEKTGTVFPSGQISPQVIKNYHLTRDFPALAGTTRLGVHLRFGTVSIRELVRIAFELNETWLSELIWREFFMTILYLFPHVENYCFKSRYDNIQWVNDEKEFDLWRQGLTGCPLVDAGMRELNQTGLMHNRVRMVTASFLVKNLLIDWRKGERYFAEKLLDYDLAANNGNWQWVAGTGCDAAPYFRIFNPETQLEKFDKDRIYVKKWVPEYGSPAYPDPIVDIAASRNRAIMVYKQAKAE